MLALYISLGVVLLLAPAVFIIIFISRKIYTILLVRETPDKWGRDCSWDNEEQREMFRIGLEWGEENAAFHKQVSVKSEGLRLVGEYYDFGGKKAVIIIPGRMETCAYSYYFAKPYKELGYNILAIDNRSHGLSEGKYNTIGLREYKDIIEWAKLLKTEFGVESVLLHGICIGGATATYAATDPEGKKLFDGLVTEGMYNDFGIMLKYRFKERKKPTFPFIPLIMSYIRHAAGKSAKKFCPYNMVNKLEIPIMFIYSREDVFSDPANVQKLYDKCAAKKRICWFDKGIHSHIRINDECGYDEQVKQFVRDFV
ncbi:MAG: lysophospholipase [Clostridiales bacterium]|nr:lysophospholipase [Clostridiales bacterium]